MEQPAVVLRNCLTSNLLDKQEKTVLYPQKFHGLLFVLH